MLGKLRCTYLDFIYLKAYKLIEILGEERQATRENVERKQARTSDELEEDEDADAAANDESDDEEEQILYNPKNLPLGNMKFGNL